MANIVVENTGTLLDPLPSLYAAPALTNDALNSNDLTNASWFPTNVTVTQDQAGIDGTPNTATRLTATAANGIVLDGGTTAASDDQTTKWYIKRLTGVGVIELTVDNAVSWVDITASLNTSDFIEVRATQAALTNPVIGIRIVTSGDEVIVGNAETHVAKTEAEVRGGSPIITAGTAASTVAVNWDYLAANYGLTGLFFVEAEALGTGFNVQFISNSAAQNILSFGNGTLSRYEYDAGLAQLSLLSFTPSDGRQKFAGAGDDNSSDAVLNVNGVYSSPEQTNYNGRGVVSFLRVNRTPVTAFLIRNIRRYDDSYDDAKAIIDALMLTTDSGFPLPSTGSLGTRPDAKNTTLGGGNTDDKEIVFLQANGATSDNVNDAWVEFLAARGFTTGNLNTDFFEFLGSLGFTGALADRKFAWWAGGASLTSQAQVNALSGLTSLVIGLTSISMEWIDPPDGTNPIDHFDIYRDLVFIQSVGIGVQAFDNTGLDPDTEYVYIAVTVDDLGNESIDSPPLVVSTLAEQMTVTEYGTEYGDKVADTLLVLDSPDAFAVEEFVSVAAGRMALMLAGGNQDTLDPTVTVIGFPGGDKVLAMTWHGAGNYYRTANMAGIRDDFMAELGNSFDLTVTWA